MKYTLCVICGNITTWKQALDYGLCKECDKPENRQRNPDPVMNDNKKILTALRLSKDELERWYSKNDIEPSDTFAIKKIDEAIHIVEGKEDGQ